MMIPAMLTTVPEPLCTLLCGGDAAAEDIELLKREGSMTRALAERFGPVRVERLREGLIVPHPGEARMLESNLRGGFWCREIRLFAGGAERLEARTLVPPDAVQLRAALRRLGDRPLMDLLFLGDRLRPGVIRDLRCFGRTCKGHLLRLSRFRIHREPLLLLESLRGLDSGNRTTRSD